MSATELKSIDGLETWLGEQYKDADPAHSPSGLTSRIKPLFQKATLEISEQKNFDLGGTDIVVRGRFPGIGLEELTDAFVSLGAADWRTHVPEAVRKGLGAIKLNEAGICLNKRSDGIDLTFFDFQLEFSCPPLELLEKSLSIGLKNVHFYINDPLNSSDSRRIWALFNGTLVLLGLDFNVIVRVPDFFISAEHLADTPREDLMTKAMGDLPAPPKGPFNIIRLSAIPGNFYTLLLDANAMLDWELNDGKRCLLHVNASLHYNVLQTGGAKNSGFAFPITGWHFEADAAEGIPVQALLEKLARLIQGLPPLQAPSSIHQFSILGFSIGYDVPTKDFKFSAAGMLKLGEGQTVTARLSVEIARQQDGTYQKHFGGVIQFAGQDGELLEFDVVFETAAESKTFLALYRDLSGTPVPLRRLVAQISPELGKQMPESFTLKLKQALYAYTVHDGKPKHLFGIEIDGGINLSDIKLPDLPLVGGSLLPPDQRLELAFRLLAASDTFDQQEINSLESLVNNGLGLPRDEIKTLAVQTTLKVGGEARRLNLPLGVNDQGLTQSNAPAADAAAPANPAEQVTAVTADDVKWISIQKSFGPVHLERFGLKIDSGAISGLLDASLKVSALTIALDGLTMRSPLDHFAPEFSLRGMSIDFSSDELEIGGSFLRQELQRKIEGTDKVEPYVAYGGMAVIRTSKLTLSAIGSYTLLAGHPSLFIYAVVNYPIGGPPFFFVTGLAAGFGFNRALVMPDIDEVKTFPLVEQVRRGDAPDLKTAGDRQSALVNGLAALESYIPPQVGQYFLAVGIRFTSFKIVDSFALLAVQFGRQVEIDLLGSSILIAPPGAGTNVAPVARAELALKARYVPAEGFLSVIGKLTSDSFILSRDCHLQGGFAFFGWFSGEHDGDFVLTLGGYHPRFNPPAHYPKVPRLGVSWHISNELSVKGELYFALTPHAIMAGGNLEAMWQEGPIRAWFKAGVDFLLQWQPYHYDARVYVSIGASYSLDSYGNNTISAELGADLHVWGPDFAMTADVHCFVFTIHIEHIPNPQPVPKVTWNDFHQAFLPKADQVCEVHAVSGLLHQTGSGKDTYSVVDLKAPAFAVNTTIPVNRLHLGPESGSPVHSELNFFDGQSELYFFDTELTQVQPFRFETQKKVFVQSRTEFSKKAGLPGVRPMKVKPGDFKSLLKMQIKRLGGQKAGNVESEFTMTPVLKQVPAALWGTEEEPASSDELNPKSTLIRDAVVGFELHPAVMPQAGAFHSIPIESLRYAVTPASTTIGWEDSVITLASDADAIAKAKYDSGAKAIHDRRNALLEAVGISTYRFDFSHLPSSGVVFTPQMEELKS